MSAVGIRAGSSARDEAVDAARPAPYAALGDAQLVARIAAADDGAFACLYDRYGSVAHGLALRVLRDRTLAEDAVQEAFAEVWRGAGRFSAARGSVRSWLLMLVHRRAVDLVRREERRRSFRDVGGADAAPSADETASLTRARTAVQDALAQLPPAQRRVLELAYYGGLSQTQVAERLGEPLGTVKSRMFAGLNRLRDLLADSGVADVAHAS